MSGEPSFSNKVPKKEQPKTDFAIPNVNQQIPGLDSDMGGGSSFACE